jgi:hypothetical protein
MPSALHHSCALEIMSSTYGHDRIGTMHHGMQLHTLLGVQVGDILHCIHMHSRSILKVFVYVYVYVIMKLYHLAMFKIESHSFHIDIISCLFYK